MIVEAVFSRWLVQKFREWESTKNGRQTVSGFARYLGVKQPTLSRWMQGDTVPDMAGAVKLSEKYPDIYGVLGLDPPPDPLAGLPEDFKQVVLSVQHELAALDVRPDSPEGIAMIDKILARYGFTRIVK